MTLAPRDTHRPMQCPVEAMVIAKRWLGLIAVWRQPTAQPLEGGLGVLRMLYSALAEF